jgi:hypothetical protein
MPDEEPKSAIELAMERLRKKDADAGITERPLSAAQKQAIAEARNICEAKLAEIEILYRSKFQGVSDPEAHRALEQARLRDVQRATEDRDRKITQIRQES